VADGDHLVPAELAIAAYKKAHQPKELAILPGGHFDAYTVGFATSSGWARDWFVRHLALCCRPARHRNRVQDQIIYSLDESVRSPDGIPLR
jgi:hypothetical protein